MSYSTSTKFLQNCSNIERKTEKLTCDGYIHNIICQQSILNEGKITTPGKAHWSQCRNQAPHALTIHTEHKRSIVLHIVLQ